MPNIYHPTDQVTEEDKRDLLEQLPAPMILLGDFNTHNPLWGGSEKKSTTGIMLEKILDRHNLLCLNEKEETYYRAYDGCKSTIDLTFSNLTIASEYKLSRSEYLPIIIKDEKEVSTKQHQGWSVGSANLMQFQKESKITTKVQDQNTIEEAHSCLVKTVLQAVEKTISKTSPEIREGHQYNGGMSNVEGKRE